MNIDKFGTKTYRNLKKQLHRLDGPAEELLTGTKIWYILGKYLEEKEFNLWILRIPRFL